MSSVTREVRITMLFDDNTTETNVLPDIAEEALPNVKSRIKAINAGTADNAEAFNQTFVSNAGASLVSISAGSVVITTEEVLYNGN